jgi:type II secretory pathway component PulK
MVTVMILALSVFTFMMLMQTEEQATRLITKRIQSKYLVDSGVDYSRLFLSEPRKVIQSKGGWWDNPTRFQAIPVAVNAVDPRDIGYFSVVAPNLDDSGMPYGHRFGLTDESTKLNLNVLPYLEVYQPGSARDLLVALPGVTEDIADAILDFIDPDDDTRDYGYESDYYASKNPPYAAKNGPLDSLDELLLVEGVTAELLYGLDVNRNGILDPVELEVGGISNVDADMYLGLANYITLYSKETNLNSQGLTRVNINKDDLEQLYDDLRSSYNQEWANFVIHYRTSAAAPITQPPSEASAVINSASMFEPDFDEIKSARKFTSVLDLVNAYVKVDDPENLVSYVVSPINLMNLPLRLPILMENMTTNEGATIPGRVNIMKAPRRILEGIPGFDAEIVETLLSERLKWQEDEFEINKNRKYETWLLAERIVDLATMKSVLPYICVRGDVYKAEIVGYFADGAGTSRAEAVFDTTVPVPRLLFWRDKSELPAAYSVEVLGTELIQ